MPTLTQKANSAFTHQPIPQPGPALNGAGMKVEFSDVLKTSLQHADLVHVGDQSHGDRALNQLLNDRKTMIAAAEGGASHVFVEWPQARQKHFDALTDGQINKTEFATRMMKDGNLKEGGIAREVLEGAGESAMLARRLGMEVHAADPENGKAEGNAYFKTMDQMEAKWDQMSPAERGAAQDQLRQQEVAFNKARLGDTELASFVDQKLSSGKGVMIYGGEHGSQRNDFNEHLKSSSVKIDTYPDRASYEEMQITRQSKNALLGTQVGADNPELIYIADEKRVYTTPDTPPDLAREIEAMAVHEPAPAPQAPRPELENDNKPQYRNNANALTM